MRDESLIKGPAGRGKNNWGASIDNWCAQIQAHIGARLPQVCQAMRMRFSTTTPVSATAFNMVFMAAFKRYFEYYMDCVCGIPHVELHGTKEDWEKLVEGLGVLDEIAKVDDSRGVDLVAWKQQMQQVLRHFVAAYDDPDKVRERAVC